VFSEGDQFPLDLGREVAEDGFVGGMNAEGGSSEQEARGKLRDFSAGEVALPLEGGERAGALIAGRGLAVGVEGANANPVVEGLEGEVKIFVGF